MLLSSRHGCSHPFVIAQNAHVAVNRTDKCRYLSPESLQIRSPPRLQKSTFFYVNAKMIHSEPKFVRTHGTRQIKKDGYYRPMGIPNLHVMQALIQEPQ